MSDIEILNRRNVAALAEAANADRVRLHSLESRTAAMHATIMTLSQTVTELRQQVATLAADRGRGRTAL